MKSPWKSSSKTEPASVPAAAVETAQPVAIDPTAAKGRPTPKRRDAQPRRSGPVAPPPATAKEARIRRKELDTKRRADIKAGKAVAPDAPPELARKDAGPERKFVRDLVDSKRHIASFFPAFAVLLIVLVFVGSRASTSLYNASSYAWLAIFFVIIFESLFLGRTIRRRVKERFPKSKERMSSLAFYGIMRALMFRKGRWPRTEVALGTKV